MACGILHETNMLILWHDDNALRCYIYIDLVLPSSPDWWEEVSERFYPGATCLPTSKNRKMIIISHLFFRSPAASLHHMSFASHPFRLRPAYHPCRSYLEKIMSFLTSPCNDTTDQKTIYPVHVSQKFCQTIFWKINRWCLSSTQFPHVCFSWALTTAT